MKKYKEFINENNDEKSERLNVKVKHLIGYLETLDKEAEVHLDKDGWMLDWYDERYDIKDEVDFVSKRGIFDYWKDGEKYVLTINN